MAENTTPQAPSETSDLEAFNQSIRGIQDSIEATDKATNVMMNEFLTGRADERLLLADKALAGETDLQSFTDIRADQLRDTLLEIGALDSEQVDNFVKNAVARAESSAKEILAITAAAQAEITREFIVENTDIAEALVGELQELLVNRGVNSALAAQASSIVQENAADAADNYLRAEQIAAEAAVEAAKTSTERAMEAVQEAVAEMTNQLGNKQLGNAHARADELQAQFEQEGARPVDAKAVAELAYERAELAIEALTEGAKVSGDIRTNDAALEEAVTTAVRHAETLNFMKEAMADLVVLTNENAITRDAQEKLATAVVAGIDQEKTALIDALDSLTGGEFKTVEEYYRQELAIRLKENNPALLVDDINAKVEATVATAQETAITIQAELQQAYTNQDIQQVAALLKEIENGLENMGVSNPQELTLKAANNALEAATQTAANQPEIIEATLKAKMELEGARTNELLDTYTELFTEAMTKAVEAGDRSKAEALSATLEDMLSKAGKADAVEVAQAAFNQAQAPVEAYLLEQQGYLQAQLASGASFDAVRETIKATTEGLKEQFGLDGIHAAEVSGDIAQAAYDAAKDERSVAFSQPKKPVFTPPEAAFMDLEAATSANYYEASFGIDKTTAPLNSLENITSFAQPDYTDSEKTLQRLEARAQAREAELADPQLEELASAHVQPGVTPQELRAAKLAAADAALPYLASEDVQPYTTPQELRAAQRAAEIEALPLLDSHDVKPAVTPQEQRVTDAINAAADIPESEMNFTVVREPEQFGAIADEQTNAKPTQRFLDARDPEKGVNIEKLEADSRYSPRFVETLNDIREKHPGIRENIAFGLAMAEIGNTLQKEASSPTHDIPSDPNTSPDSSVDSKDTHVAGHSEGRGHNR